MGNLEEQHSEKRTTQIFALLSARLCIDPAMNNAESVSLAQESVKSHLRFVMGWKEAGGFFATSTPSEPIVSDASAAVLMRKVHVDVTRDKKINCARAFLDYRN